LIEDPAMPSRELTHDGASLPQRVSADLGAAFARAGLAEHAIPSLTPRSAAVSALRPDRRSGRPLAIGMAVAAGVAGLALGVFVIRPPSAPAPPRLAAQAPPNLPQTASLDSLPALAAETPAPIPAAEPATIRLATRAAARDNVRPARVRDVGSERPTAAPPLCPTGESCRAAVLDADRHLREAYARAVRLGVPHYVLVQYRDRWADLREQAIDRPGSLVQSYGALARELRQETAEARGGGDHLGRRQSGFHLRTIVPWW
jgi:hypothetical protein